MYFTIFHLYCFKGFYVLEVYKVLNQILYRTQLRLVYPKLKHKGRCES
jgi:hypothetical protein